ncbi:MAG: (2Fe-2S)-binding protein [Anaerolineae bacterium]|nr:(2Fe-2S)-binding protein [Anaerolineae bacterium]
MPKLTINHKTIHVPEGKRLVLAIEDSGIPILHRCGGYAKCTTCRVEFLTGEPQKTTQAEESRLMADPSLYGKVRLSCQILCEQDMTVNPVMTLYNADVSDPGKRPEDHITPEPVWIPKS